VVGRATKWSLFELGSFRELNRPFRLAHQPWCSCRASRNGKATLRKVVPESLTRGMHAESVGRNPLVLGDKVGRESKVVLVDIALDRRTLRAVVEEKGPHSCRQKWPRRRQVPVVQFFRSSNVDDVGRERGRRPLRNLLLGKAQSAEAHGGSQRASNAYTVGEDEPAFPIRRPGCSAMAERWWES
jgi:hypothetical protein